MKPLRSVSLLALTAAAYSAHAGAILGIDNSRIYSIDLSSGVAISVGSLTGSGTGQANALAYDGTTNTAYFQRNNLLYGLNLSTQVLTSTGLTIGNTAAATFFGGSYYYMSSSGTRFFRVDLTQASLSTVLVNDFTQSYGFGDIATDASGTVFGSSGSTVFSFVNSSPYPLTVLSNQGVQSQLGFSGGTLYGIATGNAGNGTGNIYRFQGASGMVSTGLVATYNGSALSINDAASITTVPAPLAALPFALMALRRRKRA